MEGHIKIDFIYSDGTFNYSDALYLPEDHTFTDEQIEAMKKERFDNWKAFITNPPAGPTDEELVDMGILTPGQQPVPENEISS
jgi:hypothetical protein